MKYYKIIQSFSLVLVILLFTSCSEQKEIEEETIEESGIIISKTQFANEAMEIVKIEEREFQDMINSNGLVQLQPDALASIYSSISGKIKSIPVQINSSVSQGEILCEIESTEYIQIQRDYLASTASLKTVSANYKRTKDLFEKNISSEKEYLKLQSEYEILKANHQALKAQLQLLNVDLENLNNGNLSTYLAIPAPISGYVNEISVNLGQYIRSSIELMSIIDGAGVQLQFPVYAHDLVNIEEGQSLNYYHNDFPEQKYEAHIISIGKSMLSNRQASLCIAEIKSDDKSEFVSGLKVQVEVLANIVKSSAIPNQAIIKSDGKFYILRKIEEGEDEYAFEKVRVELGRSSSTHTELLSTVKGEVLAKGAYYFLAE